jgi:hypothetical protein
MTLHFNRDPIKYLVIALMLIITLLWLTSCTPQIRASNKLKRANKLIEQAKQLDPTVSTSDTILIPYEVIVGSVRIDTMFRDIGDTVTLENDRILVRYVSDTVTNDVFIEAECKADTIRVQVPCVQEILIQKQSFLDSIGIDKTWEKILFWLGVVLLVLLFVWGLIKKVVSPL